MNLPTNARLRRALAQKRVRELRDEHPVLEWLFGRFVAMEGILSSWARGHAQHEAECRWVLRLNGYQARVGSITAQHEAQAATLASVESDLSEGEKPTLLLVDDEVVLLRSFQRILRSHFRVLQSQTPQHALRTLEKQPVDVVLADCDIPGTEGGIWLLEETQRRFPDVVRVLVSSRQVSTEDLRREAIGQFVHKRASVAELVEQLAGLLGG